MLPIFKIMDDEQIFLTFGTITSQTRTKKKGKIWKLAKKPVEEIF